MTDLLKRSTESDSMEIEVLPAHPLFSTILTLYLLFLLYSPPLFVGLLLSPVPALAVVVLLTLLRFGVVRQPVPVANAGPPDDAPGHPEKELIPFVGWDVKAPLEVIYEDCEGEDGRDRDPGDAIRIERWPSLSNCYPESDSNSGSDSDSDSDPDVQSPFTREFPAMGDWGLPEEDSEFRWADPDKDGLIEIRLDLDRHLDGGAGEKKGRPFDLDFRAEEENLIEIDISPERDGEFPAGEMVGSRRGDEMTLR